MLNFSSAIVLRTVRTGDTTRIVDMLTEQFGRLSFVIHIGRGRSRAQSALLQPLTIVEVGFDYRPSAQFQYIRDIHRQQAYASIPTDASKMAVAMFLAEFLTYATRGEHEAALLYSFVVKSVLWYDAQTTAMPNFHIVFMIYVLRLLGFVPQAEHIEDGDFFDLQTGEYLSVKPQHDNFVAGDELRLIPLTLSVDYSTMHHLRMNRQERNRATDIILRFCQIHLPQFPPLRSLEVVRSLF